MEEEFDLCAECPCKNCTDETCFQAGCDGSRYGEGCIAFNGDCPLTHKPVSNNSPASACPVDAEVAVQNLSVAQTASLAVDVASFDFGADFETNAELLREAQIFMVSNVARIMAAKRAHDRTADHYRGSWGKWCKLVGISRDTGDNMVRVAERFGNIQIEGQSLIDIQPLKLLYDTSKPSTPPEIRKKVENLDITTHKQYREAMAQLKAAQEAQAKAEHQLEEVKQEQQAERESNNALLASEHQRRQQSDEARIDAEKKAEQAQRERESMRDIVIFREKELAEEADRADAAERRVLELESRPIDIAVQEPDPAEINRLANQKAAQMTAMFKAQILSLEEQLEDTNSQTDTSINTIYSAASEFAAQAATTINGIRIAFWTLAKELSETDFNAALEPLEQAVKQIYCREWEYNWTDDWNNEMEEE